MAVRKRQEEENMRDAEDDHLREERAKKAFKENKMFVQPLERADLLKAYLYTEGHGMGEFVAEIKDLNPGKYPSINKFREPILEKIYLILAEAQI